MKKVELPYVTIHYNKPIVHLVFKEGVKLDFPEIKELTKYSEELSEQTPYFVFSDVALNVDVTPEGRKAAADDKNAPLHRGSAVLVNSTMLKLAANFFTNFSKPLYPFRAFTDKQKAIDWLLSLNK